MTMTWGVGRALAGAILVGLVMFRATDPAPGELRPLASSRPCAPLQLGFEPSDDPLPHKASARIGSRWLRHGRDVRSVAYSPDGDILASCGWDGHIRLWDARTGRPRGRFGHQRSFESVAFSPDGKTIASTNGDHRVQVWNVVSGRELKPFARQPSAKRVLGFSSDGRTLICETWDGAIRLWSMETGQEQVGRGIAEAGTLSPALDGLARYSRADGRVHIIATATGREMSKLPALAAGSWLNSMAFSPDGRVLATAQCGPFGGNSAVRLWDVRSSREIKLLQESRDWPHDLVFSPDGRVLAAPGFNRLYLWDVTTGRLLHGLSPGGLPQYFCNSTVAFSPDGRTVATGIYNAVCLWDVRSGRPLAGTSGRVGSVECVAVSSDGNHVASGMMNGTIVLSSLADGREVTRFEQDGGAIGYVAFSSDDRRLVWTNPNETLVCDLRSGRSSPLTLADPDLEVPPTGRLPESAFPRDHPIHALLFGSAPWKQARSFTGLGGVLAVTPDHRMLATIRTVNQRGHGNFDIELRLEDLFTGRLVHEFGLERWSRAAFSPDGRSLAAGTWGGDIVLFDLASSRPGCRFPHDARSMDFSPDGRFLATGGDDTSVRVWEVSTGRELATLFGHEGTVTCVAFTPDGRHVVSGSSDGTALAWSWR